MNDELAFVIEDDADASTIFETALQKNGFQTEAITLGDEALQRLKEATPGLIILDLHLPFVNGPTILETVRADERFEQTIIVVVSADARMAEQIRNQVDLVLLKPTTFSQVRDLVARLMQRRISRKPRS